VGEIPPEIAFLSFSSRFSSLKSAIWISPSVPDGKAYLIEFVNSSFIIIPREITVSTPRKTLLVSSFTRILPLSILQDLLRLVISNRIPEI
jgi:hypothetical protein